MKKLPQVTFTDSTSIRLDQVMPAGEWVALQFWPGHHDYRIVPLIAWALTVDQDEVLGDAQGLHGVENDGHLVDEVGQRNEGPDFDFEHKGYFRNQAAAMRWITDQHKAGRRPGIIDEDGIQIQAAGPKED